MSFLQPALLAALPLAALPILIHLINQRRYQTVDWAAMSFLLAASRMSRGYARIRQWLILALRTLAIAALLFAAARPLASGWTGLAGGEPDAVLICLDRSPSMQQRNGASAKLDAARAQLAATLETAGAARYVFIDSGSATPREIAAPSDLLQMPQTSGIAAAADVPGMLQAAHDYIKQNGLGHTEIWIVSDLRSNDWTPGSGRWQALREAFLAFPQEVRFHLLAYDRPVEENLAVRVVQVRREESADGGRLVLSLVVDRDGSAGPVAPREATLGFEIDGARSETTVDLTGDRYELNEHVVALARQQKRGWGRVSLPADSNLADNESYFVYDVPPPQQTVIVTEDAASVRPLQLAAAISPDPTAAATADIYQPSQLTTLPWETTALLLWQAPLPEGPAARLVEQYVERGGQVIFFPPPAATGASLFGMQWGAWVQPEQAPAVDHWRGDHDLWSHTQTGAALPIGKLTIHRYCELIGPAEALARLSGGAPLLARVATDRGGVYFCATTVRPEDSSLATEGVALYVAVQRAIQTGALVLGKARQIVAGDPERLGEPATWRQLAGDPEATSVEYGLARGAYADDQRLWAVNRPAREDHAATLDRERAAALFAGLDFYLRAGDVDAPASLVQEVWRTFLLAMSLALVGEAALCLPRVVPGGVGR